MPTVEDVEMTDTTADTSAAEPPKIHLEETPELLVKIQTLNLPKNVKGILIHNAYFYVGDLLKHYTWKVRGKKEGKIGAEDIKVELTPTSEVRTDPKIDEKNLELIR